MEHTERINLTYIISDIDKALSFEWIADACKTKGIPISFVLLNAGKSTFEDFLKERKIPVTTLRYRGKKDMLSAIWKLRSLLKRTKPDVVHCHFLDANIIGLLAAKSAGIKTRVYTRHHSSFHHVYFPRAVYYDKLVNYLATDIVSISEVVSEVLTKREGVKAQKIHLIPHGLDLDLFSSISAARVKALKDKYSFANRCAPVVGVVARQTHWKGIQYIIPAFKKLLTDYPEAHLVLANAKGAYKAEITQLLNTLPSGTYTEIAFEYDSPALYQLFDVYVHTPIDHHSEAFGLTYVEALAAKIPSVFTLSGIANTFIRHKENAWVVPYQDAEAIYEGFKELLTNPSLKEAIIQQGFLDVYTHFSFKKFFEATLQLYQKKSARDQTVYPKIKNGRQPSC